MGGKEKKIHFYHQLPILILDAEAQLHLWYDAKDRLTTSHKHTQKKLKKKKKKKLKKKAVIGKIHLCPVQNMERNLYALPSQMRVQQQISNIKQRKMSYEPSLEEKSGNVQAPSSTLLSSIKDLG